MDDFSRAKSRSQVVEDNRHHDTGAANAGFAVADIRFNGDVFSPVHAAEGEAFVAFSQDAASRLTTPSSPTGVAGAAPAWRGAKAAGRKQGP